MSHFAKKSNPAPGFRNSPQPIVLEKSCLHDKSLEKSRYKNSSFNEKHLDDRQSVEKQHDDRLGVCLPEVKGADGKGNWIYVNIICKASQFEVDGCVIDIKSF